MTYLQIVNAVLRRLREDQTSVVVGGTNYVLMIGAIVNEVKREVEDAWDWSHLRHNVDLSTSASTNTYSLAATNERTRFLDTYNVSSRWPMSQIGNNVLSNWENIAAAQESSPTRFDVVGVDTADADKMKVRLWPTPDAVQTIRFYCITPQADLAADATVLKVPADPVIQGAYLRAINERGEDQGRLSDSQAAIYANSLGTHVAIDANKFHDEITWRAI